MRSRQRYINVNWCPLGSDIDMKHIQVLVGLVKHDIQALTFLIYHVRLVKLYFYQLISL